MFYNSQNRLFVANRLPIDYCYSYLQKINIININAAITPVTQSLELAVQGHNLNNYNRSYNSV